MSLQRLRMLAVLLTALALVPAGAHLLEMPGKLALPRDDYLTVQAIYRGWALLGIVILGALLSTLANVIVLRLEHQPHALPLLAFACVVAAQAVFWSYTFPANQQTDKWTVLPQGWMALRAQWEYSHAASAVLNLVAMASLIVASLRWKN